MDKTKTQIVLSKSDAALPGWFRNYFTLSGGLETITLNLKEDSVEIEGNPKGLKADYVIEDDKKMGVGIMCTLLSDDINISSLLKIGDDSLFEIPQSLTFLAQSIKGLDACFTLLDFCEDNTPRGEMYVISYTDKIPLVTGILEFDKATLLVQKWQSAYCVVLTGEFEIAESVSLVAEAAFSKNRITVILGTKDEAFPSFLTILKWIAKELDVGELFGWLDDDVKNIFDVAITQGSLAVDMYSLSLADYSIGMLITLWGLKLDVTYMGAVKILRGSCRNIGKGEGKSFMDKIRELTGSFPDALADIEITDVDVEFNAGTHAFSLSCTLSNVLTVGSFNLEEVRLSISKGSTASFTAKGVVKLDGQWAISASVTYESGGTYIFWGNVSLLKPVDLPDIPFLSKFLMDDLEISWNPVYLLLKDGKLAGASAEIKINNSKKDEDSLEDVLKVETSSGGFPVFSSEKKLPETGALESGSGARWKNVSKKLGPVSISRAGLSFDGNAVYAVLDGSVTLGMVELGLIGFKVGFNMAERMICGELNGISVSCSTKSFGLSGTIYKGTDLPENVKYSYSGGLSFKLAKWELRAVASYAELTTGEASFFAFVNVRMMLTLLPAFTLTGVMGGLGINRKLLIPEASQVGRMPLLNMGSDRSSEQVLTELESGGYVTPSFGEYWAAIGITCTICGLLQGKVLLAVIEGEEFQAALIGSLELTLPKNAEKKNAYAYIQLFLSAVLRPESGVFSAQAEFSNDSFLLSKNCHIFGQAACSVWFGSNSHAGDFVFSIGGYHPSYQAPEHYPLVSRVGFSWQICSGLSAKGSAYLSVTPSCIMAGGNLQFNYQIGNLKAWFDANADMLLKWHPFAFDVQISIEMGISYYLKLLFIHKTISLSLGASLHLWGTPVGGSVKIHLWFLSFTISFGEKAGQSGNTLTWEELRKTLLPDENLNTIRTQENIRTQDDENEPWITEGHAFSFLCESSIPEGSIGIAPMNLNGIDSEWSIRVISPDGKTGAPKEFGLEAESVEASLPAAMFGSSQNITLQSVSTVKGVSKYVIKTAKLTGKGELIIYDYREALIRSLILDNPLTAASGTMESDRSFSMETVSKIADIGSDEHTQTRKKIGRYLGSYYDQTSGEFTNVGQQCGSLYVDCPMLAKRETA